MKFYLDVFENVPDQEPINIQHREYSGYGNASACSDAMKIAETYYTQKAMAVDILMSDEHNRLIATITVNP